MQGRPAPRTAVTPGHAQQSLMVQSYQLHAPPLSGSAAGGTGAGGAGGARGSVAGCVNAWKPGSVAWRRQQGDTPSAVLAAEGLEAGARVRCFYFCDGEELSDVSS